MSQRFYRTGTNHLLTVLYDATNVQLNPAGLQKPFLVALGENNAYYTQDLWLFSMGK